MPRFSLRLENLEPRRLMDADRVEYVVADEPSAEIETTAIDSAFDNISFDVNTDPGLEYQTLGVRVGAPTGVVADRLSLAAYPSAKVFRSDSTVIAIAGSDYSGTQKLWAIREGGETGGEIAFDIELGKLWIEQVLVDGDQLLLIGESLSAIPATTRDIDANGIDGIPFERPGKKIIAVDLSTGDIVKELELPPGYVQYANFANGNATIIAQRTDLFTPTIWPPVETSGQVYRFTWDADGLSELQTDEIASGAVTVAGNQVLVAVRVYNDADNDADNDAAEGLPGETELRFFTLTAEGVEAKGTVNIGAGNVSGIQVSASGEQAAIAISNGDFSANGEASLWTTKVLIVDLTGGDEVTLKETIAIPGLPPVDDQTKGDNDDITRPFVAYQPLGLIWQGEDYFVFNHLSSQTLTIVDLGADVTGEARLRNVELPEDIHIGHDSIRLDNDRLVFVTGDEYWALPFLHHTHDLLPFPFPRFGSNGLLTLSLSEGTVTVNDFDDEVWVTDLTLIDADTGRIGFQSNSQVATERKFVFGAFEEEGVFAVDGEVVADSYFEIFYPHKESITVASEGGLKTYGYDNLDEPRYEVRFVDENSPPLQANDDAIKLYSSLPEPAEEIQSEWIDLLANDQIPYYSQFLARIVELIDAPEGVNLAAGRYIWLDSRIESLEEPLVFRYKISDGLVESIAEVEITRAEVTEEQRTAIIEAIKTIAARDFGLPIEEITVEPVGFPEGDFVPLPGRPNAGLQANWIPPVFTAPGLSQIPFFTFRVTAPSLEAFYGSDLAANAYLIAMLDDGENQSREPVVELSLVATDDDGNEVQSVAAGESFWIELRGKDLRETAKGVFSAFLNLTVRESLSFEGTVEPGEGFSFINADNIAEKVNDQSITSLGVLDADGTLPELLDGTPQVLIRVRVTANENGAVELIAGPSPRASEETTVFESNDSVPERLIKRPPLTITIGEPPLTGEPTDVDGDGTVKAVDALRVINMVSRHGVGTIEELKARMEGVRNETANGSTSQTPTTDNVRRFDVNRNGSITPLDALLVINHLSRQNRSAAAAAESASASSDPEAIAVDPTIEEQERRRRR